jgi:hypothetical protein
MRCWLGLVALCACNQIFGLDSTKVSNTMDVRPPPMCPPIGQTPTFTQPASVLLSNNCSAVIVDAKETFALADCSVVEQGPPNMLTMANVPTGYQSPRLEPEGTAAFFEKFDSMGVPLEWDLLTYDGSSWGNPMTLPMLAFSMTSDYYTHFGAPSQATGGAHVIGQRNDGMLVEFSSTDPTSWSQVGVISTLGPAAVNVVAASLTPDGRRLVFAAPGGIYYSDRQTIGDQFAPATQLAIMGLPSVDGSLPYLTGDCGDLYYADMGGTAYSVAQ